MFNFIRKLKNIEYTEFDDPISFAIYTDEDLSNLKPLGLKYIDSKNDVKREELKRITVSKISIVSFIFLILLSIIMFII